MHDFFINPELKIKNFPIKVVKLNFDWVRLNFLCLKVIQLKKSTFSIQFYEHWEKLLLSVVYSGDVKL